MEATVVQNKLRQFFPHSENFNILQFNGQNLTQSLDKLVNSNFPHLPVEQLHNMCRKQ